MVRTAVRKLRVPIRSVVCGTLLLIGVLSSGCGNQTTDPLAGTWGGVSGSAPCLLVLSDDSTARIWYFKGNEWVSRGPLHWKAKDGTLTFIRGGDDGGTTTEGTAEWSELRKGTIEIRNLPTFLEIWPRERSHWRLLSEH